MPKPVLRQEKKQRVWGQAKAAGSGHQGRVQAAKNSFPKAAINLRRSRAEAVAGAKRSERDARIAEAVGAVRAARDVVREEDVITIEMPETAVPAGRTVLEMVCGGKRFDIAGPERIALAGGNGSGKTTLLRAFLGKTRFPDMHLEAIIDPIGYMPQSLDLFDDVLGAMDNLHALVPGIGINQAYATLARYLLRSDRVNLPVAALSGGERVRLTLACLLTPEPPPRLLLLDEPTNNLDITGMEELASALNCYRGALIIVCHDRRFLESIRVTREWVLEDMRLCGDRILE